MGERHFVLTDHVFNEQRVLKSHSAHLSSLRQCKGSTSLTSQPPGIDHLMIPKYSQHPHNNKTHIGELALYLYCCKSFMESSVLSKCPETEGGVDFRITLLQTSTLLCWCLLSFSPKQSGFCKSYNL